MDTHPKFVKLGLCSWRKLPVPPMLQLVQSLHASSLFLTRVLLGYITCAIDDAACAIFARLEPLLDPCAPGAHYLCPLRCSLCSPHTPRAFTRPAWSWRALPVSLMLQLVQSPNALSIYSTRVLLAGAKCPADAAACAVSERLGP